MSRSLNKVQIIGRLGQDPDVRYTANGSAMVNLSVATSESWTDKQSGEQKERTEWHRVVMYRGLAEIADKYLRKGAQIYIEGSLQTRKWQDKEGRDRYTTEIVARDLIMLGGSGQGSEQTRRPTPSSAATTPPMDEDLNDDIPF